jgi:hypothetical protein
MALLHFLFGAPLNDLALGHHKDDGNGENEHGQVGKIAAHSPSSSFVDAITGW